MNKNIYASLFRSLALIGAFALFSLTTLGCVFTQSFGPNKTLIQNGEAQQTFSPCESGTLEFVSVYMQSTNDETFGAHMNIYEHINGQAVLVHQQQVVVPSALQNPYAKVWLTHDVDVNIEGTYSMEVVVPSDRSANFFMAPEGQAGLFTANNQELNGNLAFEYGINAPGWNTERVMDDVWTFEPDMAEYHGCAVSQPSFNDWAEFSGGTLSQSFEACVLSDATVIYFNGSLTQGAEQGLIFWISNAQGEELYSKLVNDAGGEYLTIDLEATVFEEDQNYWMNFKVLQGQTLNCGTIDIAQMMEGTASFDGEQVETGMCFITAMNELEEDEDGTEQGEDDDEEDEDEDDDEVDEDDAWWNPLHHRPTRKGESVFYKAYPNPFSTQFSLTFEDAPEGKATIAVYSFTGVKVYETVIEDLSLVQKLDVIPEGELSKGYYTIRIEHGESIILDTVVKH